MEPKMKKLTALITVLTFFYNMNSYSAVEKITYRGWPDCYRITNELTEIVINASTGGRIMVYKKNGIDVIYENPSQNGKTYQDFLAHPFDPDAGRFDYGQESVTQKLHALTWMGPWEGEIVDDYTVVISSQPDQKLGLLSTRTFTLDPGSSRLKVIQTMKNITGDTLEYFFWGRTLVKTGGKLFMPLNPESVIPGKWGRYIWGDPVKYETDPDDPGVDVEKNMFSLIPEEAGNQKYGNDSHAGWMAYGFKGLIFVKEYGYFPEKAYREHYNQTNIFYVAKKRFAEMEPISPQWTLKPGGSASYTENWYLLVYPPAENTDFDVVKAKKFLLKYIQ